MAKKRYGFEIIKDPEDASLFIEFLEKAKELSQSTIGSYMKWYKFLDSSKINQEYINSFIRKYGNNSVINAMLKNYLEFREIEGIKLPKSKGREAVRLIKDIPVERIKHLTKKTYNQSQIKGLIWDIAYQGALRRVEVTKIRLCDFEWEAWLNNPEDLCYLLIHGKNKKERMVYINPETMMQILRLISRGDDSEEITTDMISKSQQYLFAHPKNPNKPISEKMVYDTIKKFSEKDIRPHELRHQRAKELESRGMSLINISKFLGHSSTTITEIYLHKDQKIRLEENKNLFKN